MKTNYILIDYENVQPTDLKKLNEDFVKIKIFIGASQKTLPANLVLEMQSLKGDTEYIQISGSGKNNLDFHITYYLGKLTNKETDAHYHIISKDTGFDPLIKHLKENRLNVFRVEKISDISWIKGKEKQAPTLPEPINLVLKHLKARKDSKPASITALTNTVKSLFRNAKPSEIEEIIETLTKNKHITIENNKLIYHF